MAESGETEAPEAVLGFDPTFPEGTARYQDAPAFEPPSLGAMMGGLLGSVASDQVKESPTPRKGRGKAATVRTSDARDNAEVLVMYANIVVVAKVGLEAGISEQEENLIVGGLAETLRTSDAFGRLAKHGHPIALAIGLALWGTKIMAVWKAKHPAEDKAARPGSGSGDARPTRMSPLVARFGRKGQANVNTTSVQGASPTATPNPSYDPASADPSYYPAGQSTNGYHPENPYPGLSADILGGMSIGDTDPRMGGYG